MSRRRLFWSIGIAVVAILVIGGIAWSRRGSQEPEDVVTVRRGTVEHVVEFTGKLHAKKNVDAGFALAGMITRVLVDVGDTVTQGQLLAELDARTLNLELAKAHAEQARMSQLARIGLTNAETALANTITEQNQILERHRQSVRDAKKELDQTKEIWQQTVREIGEESSTTDTKYLAILSAESTYRAAQKALSEQRETSKKTVDTAKGTAAEAREEYLSTKQASSLDAGLSMTEASEQLAAIRRSQARLTAPFSGVVTDRLVDEGAYAQPGAAVVAIQTAGTVEIEADVPESDAAKIKEGMRVTFSLDAFGSHATWEGTIAQISPAAKTIEGVPTFRVTILSKDHDEKFHPGLTASVQVHAEKRENVLIIPRRAIRSSDGKDIVLVRRSSGEVTEQEVKTGLSGSEADIEILEGLQEGDTVVIRPRTR